MSVTKRDLPEIHVRRETKYGLDHNGHEAINYNHVPEEYLLSLSDDSGKPKVCRRQRGVVDQNVMSLTSRTLMSLTHLVLNIDVTNSNV